MVENWGVMTEVIQFRYSPKIQRIMDNLLIYHPDKYINKSHLIRCAIIKLDKNEANEMDFYDKKRTLVMDIIKILSAVKEIDIKMLRKNMFEYDGSLPSEVDRAIKELENMDSIERKGNLVVYMAR